MAKAEEYLTKEEERVDRYLVSQTKKKLLARAEEQLLSKHRKGIMEKENSGCAVLLRDGRTEDLLRMFRLFQRISDGLQPMSEIFRQHVQASAAFCRVDSSLSRSRSRSLSITTPCEERPLPAPCRTRE